MAGTGLLIHTWLTSIKNDSGTAIASGGTIIAGSAEFNEKITVPAGQTAEIDCGTIALAKIVSICLVSDKPVNVFTNAADATGGQEIDLTAGKAWAWNNQQAAANPVTDDITKIFVTNAGDKDATFRAAILMNLLA